MKTRDFYRRSDTSTLPRKLVIGWMAVGLIGLNLASWFSLKVFGPVEKHVANPVNQRFQKWRSRKMARKGDEERMLEILKDQEKSKGGSTS